MTLESFSVMRCYRLANLFALVGEGYYLGIPIEAERAVECKASRFWQ